MNTLRSGIVIRDPVKGYKGDKNSCGFQHCFFSGFDRTALVLLVGALVSFFCGCVKTREAGSAPAQDPYPERISALLPPLPGDYLLSPKALPRVEKFLEAPQRRIVVAWQNEVSPFATNYETGVEASQDFANWQEVACVPYSSSGFITLTNTGDSLFVRVCNRIRSF